MSPFTMHVIMMVLNDKNEKMSDQDSVLSHTVNNANPGLIF